MTLLAERRQIIMLVLEAVTSGARQARACSVISLSSRTLQRWQLDPLCGDQRPDRVQEPQNRLSEWERKRLLSVVNSDEFGSLPPSQIVPILADKGQYIASESTIYRVLKAEEQLVHRGAERPAQRRHKPRAYYATAPNQVVLHSDNGSPMKGATMLATLQALGVIPSFSRPSVSNDNPYSESLFKTLKYRPAYPLRPFEDLLAARQWVSTFVDWYNNEHRHSAISFVTPAQRHDGLDAKLLQKRTEVYAAAKQARPERWSADTRNWQRISVVHLNPDQKITETNEPKEMYAGLKMAV